MSTIDTLSGRCAVLVLTALAAFPAASASAQTAWDPEAYETLSQSGQDTYRRAMEHPDGSAERGDGLLEASAQMKAALAMISTALEEDAIEGDDVDNALGDYFTLMENLSVVWIRLDACVPAQGLIDTALSHPDLPDRGEVIFERLAPQMAECRERAEAWEWPRYSGLVARANLRAQQARDREPPDRELLVQATDASQDALRQYRSALFGGKLADIPVDDPVSELFTRYDETVSLLIDVGRCRAARDRVTASNLDASVLLQVTTPTSSHADRLATCVEWVEGPVSEAHEVAPRGPTTRDVISYSLLSASGVLLVSVLAVDLSSRDDRDELNDLQSACAVGPCDLDRAFSLADTIDQRKVVVGVLLGAAVATGVTGLVLLFTGDEESAPDEAGDVTWGPIVDGQAWGVGVGVRY